MANEQNLVQNRSDITPEMRREYARKAGKASGEAKRAKKAMREYADFLLSLPVTNKNQWNQLVKAGVPIEGCDNKMLVVFALMKSAQNGNVKAAKELRNIIGEDRVQDTDALQRLDKVLSELDEVMKHD